MQHTFTSVPIQIQDDTKLHFLGADTVRGDRIDFLASSSWQAQAIQVLENSMKLDGLSPFDDDFVLILFSYLEKSHHTVIKSLTTPFPA